MAEDNSAVMRALGKPQTQGKTMIAISARKGKEAWIWLSITKAPP